MSDRIEVTDSGSFKDYIGSGGHGANGQIKKASWFGKSITVQINGTEINLNKGSLIDYINSKLPPNEKLRKGYFWGGATDDAVTTAFTKIIPPKKIISPDSSIPAVGSSSTQTITDAIGQTRKLETVMLHPNQTAKIKLSSDRTGVGYKGDTVSLNITQPIYYLPKAKFGQMRHEAGCFIMNKNDFETIEKTIHEGAFGRSFNDYCSIENNRVAVWKVPADLKEFEEWNPSNTTAKFSVGEYNMTAYDTINGNVIEGTDVLATKFRFDFPKASDVFPVSIHHLTNINNKSYPIFSYGNMANNFDSITPAEDTKIDQLITDLKLIGIYAYRAVEHHGLVLYKDSTKNEDLTPKNLAEMLQSTDNGPRIKNALRAASKTDFDINQWAENFIAVYKEGGILDSEFN